MLASGVDPNTVAPNGDPVLVHRGARGQHGAPSMRCSAAKANVNARSASSATRAIMVAALSGHLDLVKKLRARGAEINGTGWTPLIYAATGGHDAVVAYLLAEGAERQRGIAQRHDRADDGGARRQGLDGRRCLLARGADVNQRNQSGGRRSTWAMRGNEQEHGERLAARRARKE